MTMNHVIMLAKSQNMSFGPNLNPWGAREYLDEIDDEWTLNTTNAQTDTAIHALLTDRNIISLLFYLMVSTMERVKLTLN